MIGIFVLRFFISGFLFFFGTLENWHFSSRNLIEKSQNCGQQFPLVFKFRKHGSYPIPNKFGFQYKCVFV